MKLFWRVLACGLALGFLLVLVFPVQVKAQGQGQGPRPGEFPPGAVRSVGDLPSSKFRAELERLPGPARERAIGILREFHFTTGDLNTMKVDSEGGVYYADEFQLESVPSAGASEPVTGAAAVPVSPFPDSLKFHSRPGSANVIFLNFAGDTITGTAWNSSLSRTSITAVAFSTDTDFTTFSDAEQLAIKRVWERVSEDYAPFDVDVTTERPASFTTRTAHALITRNTDANGDGNPSSSAGGVAYVGVFASSSYANYRPAWIYFNNLASNESYIAEAASHELGHNFGLSHDGVTGGSDYYGGHGTGDVSWGPIMGTGYNRNVSQWCKGDYYLANNTQDDLAIISGKIPYRTDDYGGTISSASPLIIQYGTNISSTTPETDPANTNHANKGIIERSTDVDAFSFVTGTGPVNLAINPWTMAGTTTRGGNLDIQAELYSDSGTLLLVSNPSANTYARIQTNLTEGVYYLLIRAVGVGDPFSSTPTGYTSYASMGQYFISGTIVPSSLIIPPKAQLQAADVTAAGTGANLLTVTYSDNAAIAVSSIDSADVRVTGPNGYNRVARLVGSDVAVNGPQVVATYAVDPPDNVQWGAPDNGAYTVWMQTNQVSDTEGAWVAGGQLGQFTVAVPSAIYIADMSTDPQWTLEPLWQYGTAGSEPGGPTAGFTGSKIIGYNLTGDYENNLTPKYATTPSINTAGATSLTLRFQRWLRLRNGDGASIQVSTNGMAWTDLWTTTRSVTDSAWQDTQYTLPSWAVGSTSLQIRWGISSGVSQTDIGWNLDDVQVLANGNVDTTPPGAAAVAANITSAGTSTEAIAVTYTDASGVKVSSLGAGDIVVTGPNNYSNLVTLAAVDVSSDGSPRTATYTIPSPGVTWQASDNGTYQMTLIAGGVSDVFGNTVGTSYLGSFTVNLPASQQAIEVDTTSINVVEGGTALFKVYLATQPASPITVTVARISGDSDLVVQGASSVVFDASNWNQPTPITIAALPDPDQLNGTAVFQCQASGLASLNVSATEIDTTPDPAALSVTINQPAWGTVSPTGGVYTVGSQIQLIATPAPYFRFDRWIGDVTGTNNPLDVQVVTNLSVEAVFSEILTTNHPTPIWWLAQAGYNGDWENVVDIVAANGFPIWESYVAGLNPNDPDSQLKLDLTPSSSGTNTVLSWTPVEGRLYSVETTMTLGTEFSALPGATNLTSGSFVLTNTMASGASSIFYRLKVEKP